MLDYCTSELILYYFRVHMHHPPCVPSPCSCHTQAKTWRQHQRQILECYCWCSRRGRPQVLKVGRTLTPVGWSLDTPHYHRGTTTNTRHSWGTLSHISSWVAPSGTVSRNCWTMTTQPALDATMSTPLCMTIVPGTSTATTKSAAPSSPSWCMSLCAVIRAWPVIQWLSLLGANRGQCLGQESKGRFYKERAEWLSKWVEDSKIANNRSGRDQWVRQV